MLRKKLSLDEATRSKDLSGKTYIVTGANSALGLVHVLAGHGVAVALGVVPQSPKLGGHGMVHVLAVAGDPGVQGRRGQFKSFLLSLSPSSVSSCSALRERSRSRRSWRRSSRSSMFRRRASRTSSLISRPPGLSRDAGHRRQRQNSYKFTVVKLMARN